MEPIKIEVSGNIARVIERPQRITAGTVGLPVEFTFDEHWEELRKTAVFRARHRTKIVENLETETTVPWELLQKPGAWLSVGVYGVNIDGSVAIPTIWANVDVIKEGADPEGDPGADPSLPVYQKLLDDVDDIDDAIDEVIEIQEELAKGIDIETVDSEHITDTNNPHGVTAEQIDAAPLSHIEDDSNPHNVTAEQIDAAPISHVDDFSNPHNVTAEQVGARPDTWIPTAEEVGAVPSDHADDTSNPHCVTAEQTGALPLSGGTMTGDIVMDDNKITGLPTPTDSSDAVPLDYLGKLKSSRQRIWIENGSTVTVNLPAYTTDYDDGILIARSGNPAWTNVYIYSGNSSGGCFLTPLVKNENVSVSIATGGILSVTNNTGHSMNFHVQLLTL